MISSIDKGNMYQSIKDFPSHLKLASDLVSKIKIKNMPNKVTNLVISGMGGSAIGGDVVIEIVKNDIDIPIQVIREYNLPNWVNKDTIVICSSYSGNTEETLSAFEDAIKKKAMICGITTGGILGKKLDKHSRDKIIIPKGLQPRAALAFSVIAIFYYIRKLGILKSSFGRWINVGIDRIKKNQKKYCLEKISNPCYLLAKNIYRKLPIFYSCSTSYTVIAKRIKGQLAENSKMLSYCGELPELNHNEIEGWKNNENILKHFVVVWMKDCNDHPRVKIRQLISGKILKDIGIKQFFIEMDGETFQDRFLNMIHFGDWLSYWCAILHKSDPTPVIKIEKLKSQLESY